MRIIPVIIRQLKINLQVKSDALIYRKFTKSAKISKFSILLLPFPLALCPLAIPIPTSLNDPPSTAIQIKFNTCSIL